MEFLTALPSSLLFCLACNLDTLLLAVGFEAKKMHRSRPGTLVLALVTSLVTYCALLLGGVVAAALSPRALDALGGLVLVGIGCWFLLDYLRAPERDGGAAPGRVSGLWGYVTLAAALAVNNAGVGVAAGMAGLSAPMAAGCNFAVTLAALPLGRWLGRRLAGRVPGNYALPLSGLLLVALGLWAIVT